MLMVGIYYELNKTEEENPVTPYSRFHPLGYLGDERKSMLNENVRR
jgi:hypothetical protein